MRRYSHALGPVERVVRASAAVAFRTGLAERVFRDRVRISPRTAGPTIETVLADVLGEPVRVSLGLGNQRANQKPVLQVMTRTGAPLAFVKVGYDHVSSALVRTEADALRQLSRLHLDGIRVPRLIGLHSWRGLDLLVMSTLHTTPRRHHGLSHLPITAFGELAAATGPAVTPLEESTYWARLRDAIGRVPDTAAVGSLSARMEGLARRYGSVPFSFGAWHGDWTPWNMSWEDGTVALWDWERFSTDVPLGFDALHYQLRVAMTAHGITDRTGDVLRNTGPDLLGRLGVDPDLAPAVLDLYLVEVTARYCEVAGGATGAPVRALSTWLLGQTVCYDTVP